MQHENQAGVYFSALKRVAGKMSLQDFAQGLVGPFATIPGSISLATGCTWQTIWDGTGLFGATQDYRISNTSGAGQIEIEVDGTVISTIDPFQSQDVSGKKIRVHAPQPQVGPSSGSYERL